MEKQKIMHAKNTNELDVLIENAAAERFCELDNSLSYAEQAAFLREEAGKRGNGSEKMLDLANLLDHAETKWFQLENGGLHCNECGDGIDAVETVYVGAEWAEYHDDDGNIVGYRDGVEHANYCPRCEAKIFPDKEAAE